MRPEYLRRDWDLLSDSDGTHIDYAVTHARTPKAIVVLQLGTLSKPTYGDLLAREFSAAGISTYAVASRTSGAADYRFHSNDLEQVVNEARENWPGVPIVVMGVSLGAATALEWNLLHNRDAVPVVAMSPVVMPRLSYLGPAPLTKIMGGFFLRRVAAQAVPSPLSAGIALTTNPDSEEYQKVDPSQTVPAGLFDDVMRMTADVTLHAHAGRGQLLVVQAGDDAVACNAVTQVWSRAFPGKRTSRYTSQGAAHDLSQETNHTAFVAKLTQWTLAHTAGREVV